MGWSKIFQKTLLLAFSLLTIGFSGSAPQVDPLTQLSIRLNAKYWRGLDQNDFSLTYRPIPPKTIQLRVRYKPMARVEDIEKIVSAARTHVVGYAKKEFNLEVDTTVDIAPLN